MDEGMSVQQTSDGGYIIAGSTESFGFGSTDVYLVKTNTSGDTLWTRAYGGTGSDAGMSVQQTSDSGYIIAGYTNSIGGGQEDVYLVKANSSGDTLWTRTYGGTAGDVGQSVQQTSDGGYIIVGTIGNFHAGYGGVYLIKTNSSGDTLWTTTPVEWASAGYSVRQTSDSGYIITGRVLILGGPNVTLTKTNSSGDVLWGRLYRVPGSAGMSAQQTSDGGYIIAGYTESFGFGSTDVYLIKTNTSGDTLWTRTYGGAGGDYGISVQQTSDSGYIIAGSTDSFGFGSRDVYLIKTQVDGLVPVQAERGILPTRFILLQNYPNPFNPSTVIEYTVGGVGHQASGFSDVRLVVYDVIGREVATLVNEKKAPGSYEVRFDAAGLASGVYFYRLEAGSFVQTKKLVVLR